MERLTPDFTDSAWATEGAAASSGPVGPPMQEAPMLLARGGVYYLVFGVVCCFCRAGANAAVHTAPTPLGPWAAAAVDIDPPRNGSASTLGAQNSFLISVPLAAGGEASVWVGDRWGAAPDGRMDHTPQVWLPLSWNGTLPLPLQWADSFSLDIAT